MLVSSWKHDSSLVPTPRVPPGENVSPRERVGSGDETTKIAGLQGSSTLSGHRMTTGFGPFELPTGGLLQRRRDHSPLRPW